MKILVMGLPGAGKTTLATLLAERLQAVHFNADDIRQNINKDLGFDEESRLEQARRMGHLCDLVTKAGTIAIADFVCPTIETRAIFKADFVVWVDRIEEGRFEDTNQLFQVPRRFEVRLTAGTPSDWVETVIEALPLIDWRKPTVELLGRYQPYHDGHFELAKNAIKTVGQVAIMVRDSHGTTDKDPFDYNFVRKCIVDRMNEEGYLGRYTVLRVPNVTNIHYGRDVGYKVERIHLDEETEAISATNIRELMKKA